MEQVASAGVSYTLHCQKKSYMEVESRMSHTKTDEIKVSGQKVQAEEHRQTDGHMLRNLLPSCFAKATQLLTAEELF